MIIFWLSLASFVGWFVSSLAGGGSPLILIPVVSAFLDPLAIPPVMTIGQIFGNVQRVFLYWQDIDWPVVWWYLPGAVVGSFCGAFVFTQTQPQWLPFLLGLLLIFSAISYFFEGKTQQIKVSLWYFLPGGALYGFLSGLVGSIGPILNPVYLNYGLTKEKMIGTKSVNMVAVHVFKIITYAAFGAINKEFILYGLFLGLAALPGNWIGQKVLKKISQQLFKRLVIGFVGLSGLLMVWENKAFLPF